MTTHIDGTEILTVFDNCSSVSTVRHNAIADAKIIEVKNRETNSQGHRIIIYPSGKELHFSFDTTAEDSDNVIEEEECLEPVSNAPTEDADWDKDATIASNKEYRRDDTMKSVKYPSNRWKEPHGKDCQSG